MATKRKPKTRKVTRNHRQATVLPKRQFPAHLNTTPDEWRALKRTEWREVTQALYRFYHGSAFTPAQPAQHKMRMLVDQVTEAIEAFDWIAW